MKKEIKIITFHASHNAGSMLQTYALKTYLQNELSCKVEIINFSSRKQQEIYSVYPKPFKIKHYIRNFLYFLNRDKIVSDFNNFKTFNNKYLSDEEFILDNEDEMIEDIKCDLYICGGDQIWNIDCEDFSDAYFLPFVKNVPKISFAVSLGATNILDKSIETQQKYKQYLSEFSAISVREKNAVSWLKKLTGKEILLMPDPTLLLSKTEWDKLSEDVSEIEGQYIFFYSMAYNKEICLRLKVISRLLDMPVVVFDAKSWIAKSLWKYGFKLSEMGGPLGFLKLIRNANLVITNSLHGTIFSAIFRKNFWSIQSDSHSKNDDRATFLLEQLGLSDRFISVSDMNIKKMKEIPSYYDTEANIQKLQEQAYLFLCGSIKMGQDK